MKIKHLQENLTPASTPSVKTIAPKFGRSDEMLESGAGSTGAGSVASVSSPVGGMQRRGKGSMFQGIKTSAKYPNSAAVKEEAMGTFAALKGLKTWQVVIFNNYYAGKYSDYRGRYYYVLATSPQEARQVVLDNADGILQELLAMKSHNGKKILPRGTAVRITPNHIGKIEDGTVEGRMSTAGFKKMFGPQGPVMVKLSGGAVVDMQDPVVQGSDLKTVAKADLGSNSMNLPSGYGDVVQPQKVSEEHLDEIFNPTSGVARFLRAASAFAGDYIPVAIGAAGTFAATTAVLGPVAAMMASSTVGSQILQTIQNQQNKVPGVIQQMVEKYFGSEQEEVEFALIHAKAAFLGQREFRWRGQQWPVTLEKNAAEAIVEKNDRYWLEQQASQQQQPAFAEAKKAANTKTVRHALSKRPPAKLSDKEQEKKKSESDAAWERLMAYAAAQEKEVKEMDGDGAGRDGSNRKRIGSYGNRDRDISGPDIHLGKESAMTRKQVQDRFSKELDKAFNATQPRKTMGLNASLEQHADDKMKELGHKFKPVDEAGGRVPSGLSWTGGKLQKRPELVAAARAKKNRDAAMKRKALRVANAVVNLVAKDAEIQSSNEPYRAAMYELGFEEMDGTSWWKMVMKAIDDINSELPQNQGVAEEQSQPVKYRATVEYGPTAADAHFVTVTANSTEEAEAKVAAWCKKKGVRNPMITINGADKPVAEGTDKNKLRDLEDKYDELDYDGNSESDREQMRFIQQQIRDLKKKQGVAEGHDYDDDYSDFDYRDEIAQLENQIKYTKSEALRHTLYQQLENMKRKYGVEDEEEGYYGDFDDEGNRIDEKSKSQAQFRTMAAVAHNPKFAKKVGIRQSVGKEFHKADKGVNYKSLPKKVDEAEVSEDKLANDLYKDLQIFKKGADKDISGKAKSKDISTKAADKDIVTKEDCWDGYEQIGMKQKNGKTVPNCVPKK
jgi:hypothetical protein